MIQETAAMTNEFPSMPDDFWPELTIGAMCACCGEREIGFLSFDHINNDGAAQRNSIAPGYHFYRHLVKNKPSDIQILCHNCNMAKQFYGVCPHHVAAMICEVIAA
jgi:hypothetical protein